MLKLGKQAKETLEDVSVASRKVSEATDLLSLVLAAVIGGVVAALLVVTLERLKE